MSITNQQLLDHCQQYFYKRLNRYNGKCWGGFGEDKSPENRCALGSLITETFNNTSNTDFGIIHALINLFERPQIFDSGIRQTIMVFNDQHSQFTFKVLTKKKIDDFLKSLADKYGLKYNIEPYKLDKPIVSVEALEAMEID